MGWSSCKIVRHRGYFFLWRSNCNGLAEDLGAMMLDEVPKAPKALKAWARKLRKEMDRILRAYIEEHGEPQNGDKWIIIEDRDVGVSDSYESYDSDGYTYEFNLDQMLFHVAYHPVFHLDNLPPADVLIAAWDEARDCYDECPESDGHYSVHYGAFHRMIPEKYRIDMSRLPKPQIKVKQFKTYSRHLAGMAVDPVDVLPSTRGLNRAEQVSLRLLGTYVNIYSTFRTYMIFEELILVSDYKSIGWNGREIACALAAVALLPLHTLDTFERYGVPALKQAENEFWFMRKHICFSLATHLHDDRNARFHISRVVEHILSTPNTPDIVFGVVFSVFHCIVFRVNTAAGGSFTRTDVLDFLAPPQDRAHSDQPPENWLTPGMEILTRLGHVPAEDDVEFFHSNLSSGWWICPTSHISRQDDKTYSVSNGADKPFRTILPTEILSMIVNNIDRGDALYSFALASKQFMAVAIPRLRLPQIRGDRFKEELDRFMRRTQFEGSHPPFGHGHILESFKEKTFPIIFETLTDDVPLDLTVTTSKRMPYIFHSDTAQHFPQDIFEWRDMSGKSETFNRFHFRGLISPYREERRDSDYIRRYNAKPHLLYGYVTDADQDWVLQERAREKEKAESSAATQGEQASNNPLGGIDVGDS